MRLEEVKRPLQDDVTNDVPCNEEKNNLHAKAEQAENVKIIEYIYKSYSGIERSIEIYRNDLQRLEPNERLNDIIINFYLKYLEKERITKSLRSRIHIFNSYFYEKLKLLKNADKGNKQRVYMDTKNWTKNVDLFTKDYILIPICDQKHWCLAIVCNPNAVFENAKEFIKSPLNYKPTKTSNLIILTSVKDSCREAGKLIKTYINLEYSQRKLDPETRQILQYYDGYSKHFKTWQPLVTQ